MLNRLFSGWRFWTMFTVLCLLVFYVDQVQTVGIPGIGYSNDHFWIIQGESTYPYARLLSDHSITFNNASDKPIWILNPSPQNCFLQVDDLNTKTTFEVRQQKKQLTTSTRYVITCRRDSNPEKVITGTTKFYIKPKPQQ